jgi:hypothetical protein
LLTLAREPHLPFAGERHEPTSWQNHGRDVNSLLPDGHLDATSSDFSLKLFCFFERGLLVLRSSFFLRRLNRKRREKGVKIE